MSFAVVPLYHCLFLLVLQLEDVLHFGNLFCRELVNRHTNIFIECYCCVVYNDVMLSTDINRLVNANDNFVYSWLARKDPTEKELYAKHIPLAARLIASRHCTQWWKNHPESVDYQSAQRGICGKLVYPCISREWTLRSIAIYLECNPLALTSDFSIDLTDIHQNRWG